MNTLPSVLAAGAISMAIIGNSIVMWTLLGCAVFVSLYTNYQWNKVFTAIAKGIAARR